MAGHSSDTEVISDSESLRVIPSLIELVSKLDSKKTSWSLNNKRGHVTLTISDISYFGHRSLDGNGGHFARSCDNLQNGVYVNNARYRNSYSDLRNTEPNSKIKRKSPSERNRDKQRLQKFLSEKHETAPAPDTSHQSLEASDIPVSSPKTLMSLANLATTKVLPAINQNLHNLVSELSLCKQELECLQQQHSDCVPYEAHLAKREECVSLAAQFTPLQEECADFKLKYCDMVEENTKLLEKHSASLTNISELRVQSFQRCWFPECTLRPDLKSCSKCKVARYCTRNCQTLHWKNGHKIECNNLKVSVDDVT